FTLSATESWKARDSNVRVAASKLCEERSGYRPAMSDSREVDKFRFADQLARRVAKRGNSSRLC
ncbi:MAG TPA: hypothetical protein VFA76_13730, partial [Terriglobales bacterium]|nr:hypothetical protein [Terriglobales bacterium]